MYSILNHLDYELTKVGGKKPDINILDLIYEFAKPVHKDYLDEAIKENDKFMEKADDLVSYYRKTDEQKEKFPKVKEHCDRIEKEYEEELAHDCILVDYFFNMGVMAHSRYMSAFLKYDYEVDIEFYRDSSEEDDTDLVCRTMDIEFAKDYYPNLDT